MLKLLLAKKKMNKIKLSIKNYKTVNKTNFHRNL